MARTTAIPAQPKPRPASSGDKPDGEPSKAPERPHFFAGEILTGEDLEAIPRWVRQRLALQRFRCRPGVVCGLEVGLKTDRRTIVQVQPGYAVSGDGDDLVLARKPYKIDLNNPCSRACMGRLNDPKGTIPIGGVEVQKADVRLVDLRLLRQDYPVKAQPVQDPCGCRPPKKIRCEARRYLEHVKIILEPGAELTPEPEAQDKNPLDDFEVRKFQTPKDKNQIIDWLLSELAKPWGQRPLGVAPDMLVQKYKQDPTDRLLTQILFWLTFSYYRQAACQECKLRLIGARLARVWLQVTGDDIQVLLIDISSLYRDVFCPCVAPCCLGNDDLSPLIGEPWAEVDQHLTALGVNAEEAPIVLNEREQARNFFATFKSASASPQLRRAVSATNLSVQTIAWQGTDKRVVGFVRKPPSAPPPVAVPGHGDPPPAQPAGADLPAAPASPPVDAPPSAPPGT